MKRLVVGTHYRHGSGNGRRCLNGMEAVRRLKDVGNQQRGAGQDS